MRNNQFNAGWTKQEEDLIRQYYGKISIFDLMELLPGRTQSALWKKAKKLDIKHPLRKLSNDDSFFSVPNMLNSYWAGFIAADGCVNSNNIEISLKRSDKYHLEQFSRDVQYTGEIKDIVKSGFPASRITICSRPWIADLEKLYSITPRKSKTLQPPNIVDEDHIKAFIIGLIDGDGCISCNGKQWQLSLRGSYDIVCWVRDWFDLWIPERRGLRPITFGSNCPTYSIGGNNNIRKILRIFETIDVPRMQRKWGRISEYAT